MPLADAGQAPQGRTALDRLSADIASADEDLLTPLSEAEREQLASLLRRVHAHHQERGPSARFRVTAQARQA